MPPPRRHAAAAAVAPAASSPSRPSPNVNNYDRSGRPIPRNSPSAGSPQPRRWWPFAGNFYSVPPELAGAPVTVVHRLGGDHLDIINRSGTGGTVVLARHRLAPDGAGALIRTEGHVTALNTIAMAAATTPARPHRRKERIPPGEAARAAAAALTGTGADAVVIDLARYAAAAAGRNTLQ